MDGMELRAIVATERHSGDLPTSKDDEVDDVTLLAAMIKKPLSASADRAHRH
jgi:hypothetical protein